MLPMRLTEAYAGALSKARRRAEPIAVRVVLRLLGHGPPRVGVPQKQRQGRLPERRVLQALRRDDPSRKEMRPAKARASGERRVLRDGAGGGPRRGRFSHVPAEECRGGSRGDGRGAGAEDGEGAGGKALGHCQSVRGPACEAEKSGYFLMLVGMLYVSAAEPCAAATDPLHAGSDVSARRSLSWESLLQLEPPTHDSVFMMNAKMIYGTAWKKERTTALVVSAVLHGFRAIDTACQLKHYREDLVGEALQTLYDKHGFKREDLFIQTKFTSISGQDTSLALPYDPSDPPRTQLLDSFSTSLRQLRTTYLDAYILHSPLRTFAQTLEAWRALAELQDAGKVRAIGLSNVYDVRLIERLGAESGRPVQIVQDRWYEGNRWDPEVVRWCKNNGAQYQSFWTLTGSPTLLAHPALIALARSKNCTPAQALYRFAQLQGITPLSGTTDGTHMREDLEVENIELSEEVVGSLVQFIQY